MADKRIALFLDGTWNTVDDNTNVYRLKSLCVCNADQVVYYSAGVGTQRGEKLSGGMLGYGLDAEVIQAYEWLVENYDPGDRIFVFGFSRGAFTARSLAGFVSKCGLLKPGSPLSLTQLYARYRKRVAPAILHLQSASAEDLPLEDRWLKKYAMAIDEHREAFAPTLWTKTTTAGSVGPAPRQIEDVEQRWFVGAHADVGGGYANGLLAQIPLTWLMGKATLHGLQFKGPVSIDGDETQVPVVGPAGTATPINETIDASVFDRWRMDPGYRPANLGKWGLAHHADIGTIRSSIRADDPSVALHDP